MFFAFYKHILRIQPVFTYFKRLFSVLKWVPMNYATYKIEKANNEKSKEICRGLNYVNLIIVAIVNLIFLILGFSEFSKVAVYLTVFATVLLEKLIRVYIFYARSWNR